MEKTTKFTSQYLFLTLKWMKPQSLHHKCAFLSHWNRWIHKVYITHVYLFVTLTQMKSQSLHHMCIFITWKWTKSQSLHNTRIFITWKWTKSQSSHNTHIYITLCLFILLKSMKPQSLHHRYHIPWPTTIGKTMFCCRDEPSLIQLL
jgi:hypothetical protein